MISVAVVEDDENFSRTLKDYISRYQRETHKAIETDFFANGKLFVDQCHEKQYDIVFMDIVMPEMDGMEAAGYMREMNQSACLIFITSMPQYAMQGYEVNAMDYVLKPLAYDLFKIKLDKAISHVRTDTFFKIKNPGSIRKILLSELMYIECYKHYLYFYLETDTCHMRGSMKDICVFFEDNGFAQISSSQMLNLSYVEDMQGDFVFIKGKQFYVTPPYRQQFWEKLTVQISGGN